MDAWRWDLIRDGLQVVLCIGMLVYLFRQRRPPEAVLRRPDIPPFDQEIRLQALRQQGERALASILSTVESEQLRLQQVFEADARLTPAALEAPGPAANDEPFRLGEKGEPAAWGRYDGVHGLSREGLSCRQIAEALNLPRGEVELALKLKPAAG